MDFRLTNGCPKVTVIQRLNHTAIVIAPDHQRHQFENLIKAVEFIHQKGWEVSVEHIHPAKGGDYELSME